MPGVVLSSLHMIPHFPRHPEGVTDAQIWGLPSWAVTQLVSGKARLGMAEACARIRQQRQHSEVAQSQGASLGQQLCLGNHFCKVRIPIVMGGQCPNELLYLSAQCLVNRQHWFWLFVLLLPSGEGRTLREHGISICKLTPPFLPEVTFKLSTGTKRVSVALDEPDVTGGVKGRDGRGAGRGAQPG